MSYLFKPHGTVHSLCDKIHE